MSISETPSNSPPPSLDTLDEGTGPATAGAAGLAGSAGRAAVIGAVGEAAVVGAIPPSVFRFLGTTPHTPDQNHHYHHHLLL